jgi:hypothetical protein
MLDEMFYRFSLLSMKAFPLSNYLSYLCARRSLSCLSSDGYVFARALYEVAKSLPVADAEEKRPAAGDFASKNNPQTADEYEELIKRGGFNL